MVAPLQAFMRMQCGPVFCMCAGRCCVRLRACACGCVLSDLVPSLHAARCRMHIMGQCVHVCMHAQHMQTQRFTGFRPKVHALNAATPFLQQTPSSRSQRAGAAFSPPTAPFAAQLALQPHSACALAMRVEREHALIRQAPFRNRP